MGRRQGSCASVSICCVTTKVLFGGPFSVAVESNDLSMSEKLI